MIFDRHTKSVFCSKPSPNGDLFASGGEDDRGFIFDRQGELYMALFGHKGRTFACYVSLLYLDAVFFKVDPSSPPRLQFRFG